MLSCLVYCLMMMRFIIFSFILYILHNPLLCTDRPTHTLVGYTSHSRQQTTRREEEEENSELKNAKEQQAKESERVRLVCCVTLKMALLDYSATAFFLNKNLSNRDYFYATLYCAAEC